MAKKKEDKIKRLRLPGEPVIVNSKAYGKHERAPRFTYTPLTVIPALKKFSDLNPRANGIAKAINDAFKPFRQDIKDGKMWSRLVGILKKKLNADPNLDLGFLPNFEFKAKHSFSRFYHASLSSTVEDSKLIVEINSASADAVNKYKASHYEQTLVIVFINKEMATLTNTHSRIFQVVRKELPKKRGVLQKYHYDTNKDAASFDVPLDTTNILIAVKCKPLKDGICKNPAASAFAVFEVIETAFVDDERIESLV
jgi:hypothetical protein